MRINKRFAFLYEAFLYQSEIRIPQSLGPARYRRRF
jgi:hypothetical protein